MSDKQAEFLTAVAHLLSWAHRQGLKVTGGELYRSVEQQAIYYTKGRSKKRYSRHQDRLAIDLNLIIDGKLAHKEDYRALGEEWERSGGLWGGRYGVKLMEYDTKVGWDANHFEWRR